MGARGQPIGIQGMAHLQSRASTSVGAQGTAFAVKGKHPRRGKETALAVRGQHMWRPGDCISSQGPVHGGGQGAALAVRGQHMGGGVGVGFHGAALADRDQHSL